MRTPRFARIACPVLVAPLLACSMATIRRNVAERVNAPAEVAGTVSGADVARAPVYVVALPDDGSGGAPRCSALPPRGVFSVLLRPGAYRLFAFIDQNGNGVADDGEPAGFHGRPTPVRALAGSSVRDVEIALGPPSSTAHRGLARLGGRECAWNVHVGDVGDLADARFGEKTGELGLWDPVRFEQKLGTGIWMLQPYDPAKIPVLFVHGASGYPREWASLAASMKGSRFQPWVFQYATASRLDAVSDELAQLVAELHRRHGFGRLFLVAHSMGGLVSRAAISRLEDGPARGVVRLFVTISTPWRGHNAAGLGVKYALVVVPSWRDMSPGSPFLTGLRDQPLGPAVDYHLFFGYRGGETLMMRENSDESVTMQSMLDRSAQAEAVRIHGFFEDHTSILSSPEVAEELRKLMDQSAAAPARR